MVISPVTKSPFFNYKTNKHYESNFFYWRSLRRRFMDNVRGIPAMEAQDEHLR